MKWPRVRLCVFIMRRYGISSPQKKYVTTSSEPDDSEEDEDEDGGSVAGTPLCPLHGFFGSFHLGRGEKTRSSERCLKINPNKFADRQRDCRLHGRPKPQIAH